MMMRFSKVTPEGSYVPPPPANSKASYATMLFVRADIVRNSGGVLSKAVTIATRYAAVRRQTAPGPGAVLVLRLALVQGCYTQVFVVLLCFSFWAKQFAHS
jgi:acyl-CoA oxidase